MSCYRFEDLFIGQREQFQVDVTADMMSAFLQISGDTNPLHVSGEYARLNGFRDRLVYGLLTSSFLSTLVGVYLPGQYCILQQVEAVFLAPVYIGDRLTIAGEITHISNSVRQVEITARVSNQDNKRVVKAKLKVGLLDG